MAAKDWAENHTFLKSWNSIRGYSKEPLYQLLSEYRDCEAELDKVRICNANLKLEIKNLTEKIADFERELRIR